MKGLVSRLPGACPYVLLALIVGMSSCEDDANDQTANKNHGALFHPLMPDKSVTNAASATLGYSQIVNAKVYILESYTDNLGFNAENCVRTGTILKDTLTVFLENNMPMRMGYRALFQELNGSTQYSVHMKGEDAQGKTSTYVSVAFETSGEQLFTRVEVIANSATLTWEETNRITHLTLTQMVDTKYDEEKQIDLTPEDIAACSKTLSELESGATYRVRVYNNDALRGSYIFKTLGLGGSEILFVEVTETGIIDLNILLSNFVKEKECSDVAVQLTPGAVYKVSELKIPGLGNILFTSTETDKNSRPQLIVTNKISLASPIQSLLFESICLNRNGEASYATDWKSSSYAQFISFADCVIQNVKRTLVRISDGSGVFVTDIMIDDYVIPEVGTDGYRMINFGKSTDQLEEVSITNNTSINTGDQLMDVKEGIDGVILENCTSYNSMDAKKELPKVFRPDNAVSTPPSPRSATVWNLIFSGPNKGKKVNSGDSACDTLNFSNNCYITSDLQEDNDRFGEITRIEQSSDGLFVDPLNGDFHIKPGAGFAGTGNTNNPHWYQPILQLLGMKNIMKNIVLSILLVSACAVIYAQADSSPYQATVTVDDSGDYKTTREAVNAVSDGQTKPWLILIENDLYNEQVIISKNKPYVRLIGQDKDKTIIHLNLNAGSKLAGKEVDGKIAYWGHSAHNPSPPVYKHKGSVVVVKGDHFYAENISYVNDRGILSGNDPQALAMDSQVDCASFYNCKFRSFQDTWMTASNDVSQHYVKDCWIEGAVDHLHGDSDVLLEDHTLYNVRSGAVIVAPPHRNAKYGYVFHNCTIDGNSKAADGRSKLGHPQHSNSKTVCINTIMLIPVADEGWTNMETVLGTFAEYNSHDAQDNVLDLSKRKTGYQYKDRQIGKEVSDTCQATITKEEAGKYMYENTIPGNDSQNLCIMVGKLGSPRNLAYQQGILKWNPAKNAIGYTVYDGEQILRTTTDTFFPASEMNYALKVSAVSQYGTQGRRGVL